MFFKPKVSKAFYHFRKGSLLSQLFTLLVTNSDIDRQKRRFLLQCGEVFFEGSDLAQRVSLGRINIRRGLFHSSPIDTVRDGQAQECRVTGTRWTKENNCCKWFQKCITHTANGKNDNKWEIINSCKNYILIRRGNKGKGNSTLGKGSWFCTRITLELWFQARGPSFQSSKAHACSLGRNGFSRCVGSAKSNRPNFLIHPYSTLQAFSSSLPSSVPPIFPIFFLQTKLYYPVI